MSRASAVISRAPTAVFLLLSAIGFIVFSTRAGIHLFVPAKVQAHTPFRQMLKGGASEIGGTPGRRGTLRSKIQWEVSQNFPFRIRTLESAALWDRMIGWNVPPLDPYLSSFFVEDGYLSRSTYRRQALRKSDETHISFLANWLTPRNIPFLYVTPPPRLRQDDVLFNGVFDFVDEQNRLLSEFARTNGIPVLSLAEKALADGREPHTLYYATDHHFTDETAQWAANAIATKLIELGYVPGRFADGIASETNGWSREAGRFEFLGSIGRKATRTWCDSEPFFIPCAPRRFRFEFEHFGFTGKNTKEEGGFDVFFRRSRESFGNLYQGYRYETICRGSGRIVRIRNLDIPEAPRLLFIADSFDNAILPFMACACSEVVSIDGRNGDVNVPELVSTDHFDAAIILFSVPPNERYLSCFMADAESVNP